MYTFLNRKGLCSMDGSLIDYIFGCSKEACLSDLRSKIVLKLYIHDIECIEDEKFTVVAWIKAYEYFTGTSIHVTTVKEVKQALREWVQ